MLDLSLPELLEDNARLRAERDEMHQIILETNAERQKLQAIIKKHSPTCDEAPLELSMSTTEPRVRVFENLDAAQMALALLEAALRAHDESLRESGIRNYAASQKRQRLVYLRDKVLGQAMEAIEQAL